MNSQENITGMPGEASSSPSSHDMSVWSLYEILTTLVGIRQFYNLTMCGQPSGETPVFEWAEAREQEVDRHIEAIAGSLAARLGLSRDDEDVRDMAFARIDGYVPSGIWLDGRIERLKSLRDFKVKP